MITAADHHSSLLPWQRAARQAGASMHVVPVGSNGCVDPDALVAALRPRTRAVVFPQISNVTGQALPVKQIAAAARSVGALTLVDAAQAVRASEPALTAGADAAVYSSHKCYGPTGSGCLAATADLLTQLNPQLLGGGQVASVGIDDCQLLPAPQRFEAGTPALSSFVGFGAALAWLREQGVAALATHDAERIAELRTGLAQMPRLRLLGADGASGCVSIVPVGCQAADVAQLLDEQGVVVRVGHHCVQLLHAQIGVQASVRLSVGCYTRQQDIQQALDALQAAMQLLQPKAPLPTR